ncbi:hypothetical protein SCHPADRAFT_840033, partial [Schizopora paradoxa]
MGAQPTSVKAWLGEYGKNPQNIITDSGADITLISQEIWKKMENPPKIKTGQPLKLVQVIGNAELTGYVTIPIFIDTDGGPVEMQLEAYVVKGMTTPLLLGNDFADQYSISIIRDEGSTYLTFGDTGRKTYVSNCVGPHFVTNDGHCFSVKRFDPKQRSRNHRKNQKSKRKAKERKRQGSVRASGTTIILPHHVAKVPVTVNFPSNCSSIYVERYFNVNKSLDQVYAAPDSLISSDNPFLQVANFSDKPIKIFPGQV